METIRIYSSVKPAVMIPANKHRELCPEKIFQRLQIVFNRKHHIAEVDRRVADYLVNTFEEITYYDTPQVQEPQPVTKTRFEELKEKGFIHLTKEEKEEYRKLKGEANDKDRDTASDNP
jgi:hypothetical protein